jgi:hypothetical protein
MNWRTRCSTLLLLIAPAAAAGACAGEVSLDGKKCPCESAWVCCSDGVCARNQESCSGVTGASGEGGIGGAGDDANECPESVDFSDGAAKSLALGPGNHVFVNPSSHEAPVENYAGQVVFPGATLSLVANFPKAPSSGSDFDPSSGTALEPWLAELSLLPEGCQPASLTGKTVHVRLLWRLGGAIAGAPSHGIYLGSYVNGEPVAYADASLVQLGRDEGSGMVSGTRTLNTLTPIELTHTFTDDEQSAYLRMYLLEPNGELRTSVYVEGVTWGEADGAGGYGAGVGGSGSGGALAGGGGTSSMGGTTGGAVAIGECTRTSACSTTCAARTAACLQHDNGAVPTESVETSGTVTAVEREAWTWPNDCLGVRGPFGGAPAERVRVDVLDTDGERWTLSFLPDLIAEDRFAPDDPLSVDFQYHAANVFNVSRKLTVSHDDDLDSFFIDASSPAAFESDASGLSFVSGDLVCPYSIPNSSGCSSARFAVAVMTDSEATDNPCGGEIGGYTVTALFESAGQAPASCDPIVGFCDAQSTFFASGVRNR